MKYHGEMSIFNVAIALLAFCLCVIFARLSPLFPLSLRLLTCRHHLKMSLFFFLRISLRWNTPNVTLFSLCCCCYFFFFAVLKNTHPFSVVNARFCFSLIFVLDFSFLSRRYLSDSKYTEKMRHFMNDDSRISCACFSDWDHSLCPSMFMTQMLENGTECEFKCWRKKAHDANIVHIPPSMDKLGK